MERILTNFSNAMSFVSYYEGRGKGHQQSPYNEVPREEEIEREMAELDSAWKS